MPRSGTSWIGEILNSSPATIYKYQPLFSYAFKGRLTPASTATDIGNFFKDIAKFDDDFLDQRQARAAGCLPIFSKDQPTHMVYKEVRYHHLLPDLLKHAPQLRLVAVIRNPLSVIASWFSAPREFRHDLGWTVAEEWRHAPSKNQGRPEEFFGFQKWLETTHMFHKLQEIHPDRVRILEYDALAEDLRAEVQRLFHFCGLQVTEQTEEFLKRSTEIEVRGTYSVFRTGGTREKWREVLPPEIAEAIVRETRKAGLGRYLRSVRGDKR